MTHTRPLAEEVALALTYDGTTEAVLMGTPRDLEDFAYGFSLTEGIAAPADILSVEIAPQTLGIDVRLWLSPGAGQRLTSRRRQRIGPVGCGLCGIDSLSEALRPPAPVAGDVALTQADVQAAVAALDDLQPLRAINGATHAAGLWRPGTGMVLVREDVGRHNALDKLGGALVRAGEDASDGVVVMSSRLSLDLVQKCAAIGAPVMLSVGAATTAAVAAGEAAGITLVSSVRRGGAVVLTHPQRIGLSEA